MLDSTEFYKTLCKAVEEARAYLAEQGITKKVSISMHSTGYEKRNEILFAFSDTSYPSEIRVTGKHFGDCLAEFCRRNLFEEQQKNLQLGPPTIEAKLDVKLDDEIPF